MPTPPLRLYHFPQLSPIINELFNSDLGCRKSKIKNLRPRLQNSNIIGKDYLFEIFINALTNAFYETLEFLKSI